MATATPQMIAEEVRRVEAQRLREEELRQQRDKTAQATITQIQKIRGEIETSVARLHELSLELRTSARRTLDASSSSHIVYANAHLRVVGALTQGLRRTASMDRVLLIGQREQEDARRREEEARQDREVREHDRLVDQLSLPSEDDFEELYGEVLSG